MYVARAREIHSCTAPPTDTLAVEVSRLTLDASAPSSRTEGKKMVDKDVLFGGSNAECEERGSLGLHLFSNTVPTESHT